MEGCISNLVSWPPSSIIANYFSIVSFFLMWKVVLLLGVCILVSVADDVVVATDDG